MPYLAHWSVGLKEVGLEVDIEEVARHAFDGVVDGQHVDTLAVLYILRLWCWEESPRW